MSLKSPTASQRLRTHEREITTVCRQIIKNWHRWNALTNRGPYDEVRDCINENASLCCQLGMCAESILKLIAKRKRRRIGRAA